MTAPSRRELQRMTDDLIDHNVQLSAALKRAISDLEKIHATVLGASGLLKALPVMRTIMGITTPYTIEVRNHDVEQVKIGTVIRFPKGGQDASRSQEGQGVAETRGTGDGQDREEQQDGQRH